MRKRKGDHVIINTQRAITTKEVLADVRCRLQFTVTMECTHCGEAFPMPTGVVQWVVDVGNAFTKAHANCTNYTKGDDRC